MPTEDTNKTLHNVLVQLYSYSRTYAYIRSTKYTYIYLKRLMHAYVNGWFIFFFLNSELFGYDSSVYTVRTRIVAFCTHISNVNRVPFYFLMHVFVSLSLSLSRCVLHGIGAQLAAESLCYFIHRVEDNAAVALSWQFSFRQFFGRWCDAFYRARLIMYGARRW